MQLCDLGNGYHLVPLAETNVTHRLHPRVQMHPEHVRARLPERYQRWLARQCDDVMAMQAATLLRKMLQEGDFWE